MISDKQLGEIDEELQRLAEVSFGGAGQAIKRGALGAARLAGQAVAAPGAAAQALGQAYQQGKQTMAPAAQQPAAGAQQQPAAQPPAQQQQPAAPDPKQQQIAGYVGQLDKLLAQLKAALAG